MHILIFGHGVHLILVFFGGVPLASHYFKLLHRRPPHLRARGAGEGENFPREITQNPKTKKNPKKEVFSNGPKVRPVFIWRGVTSNSWSGTSGQPCPSPLGASIAQHWSSWPSISRPIPASFHILHPLHPQRRLHPNHCCPHFCPTYRTVCICMQILEQGRPRGEGVCGWIKMAKVD